MARRSFALINICVVCGTRATVNAFEINYSALQSIHSAVTFAVVTAVVVVTLHQLFGYWLNYSNENDDNSLHNVLHRAAYASTALPFFTSGVKESEVQRYRVYRTMHSDGDNKGGLVLPMGKAYAAFTAMAIAVSIGDVVCLCFRALS
ncbi:hypothetical protein BDF19DRAFT_498661 [Syncephalis fuscata]|nr:hypothetical protein BDF19DRAFT_498661 [Syncephalis fuscata]